MALSGKLNGPLAFGVPGYTPVRGKDYWTEEDQAEIVDEAIKKIGDSINVQGAVPGQTIIVKAVDEGGKPTEWEAVDFPECGNTDLTGYATEQWVQAGYQPKGEYLTEVPDGYAKDEDIPIKPEDIGAQPAGNYLTEAPVSSVNGKTGTVNLSASDVGALPDTYTPPNQTAEQVGADSKGTAESKVSAHNTDTASHNDLRLELKALASAIPTKVSQLDNDKGYLTEHQDISGKLDADKLPEAVNDALAQAKESGEFDGEDGQDGYTPVKGTDYYTDADKAEFEAYIASELAKRGQVQPEFANSIEECTDTTKMYILPDGYIYSYVYVTETIKNYTNLAKTFESGRLNSSGAIVTQDGATVCADYIPFTENTVVRVKGFGSLTDYNSSQYSSNKVSVNVGKANALSDSYATYSYDSTTGIVTLTSKHRSSYYLRVSGVLTGTTADVIITANEEIKESVVTTQKWTNTGHAFVPADYEDRIIALEEDGADAKEDILTLQVKVEAMGGASGAVAIPSYWESMVSEKTEVVKALQTAGGKNCVSFSYASDLHIPDNDNGRTTDIGKVMAAIMERCEIPFAVLTGDINTRSSYSAEAELVTAQEQMPNHLYPLWGTERLLLGLGNHDGCWGDSTGYYRKQFTPERMWQTFFRWQALDFRKAFSEDGLYYYVDNAAQKVRYIMLNSHFGGEYAEDDNGWAVNNRFATSCYGQAQLDWLADVALDMPEGYGAIITAHVPPNITYTVDKELLIGIVNAYNGKSAYNGSYTAGVDGWTNSAVDVDFSGAKGEIIAMFTGHVHGDSIDTETMSCPIITILSAGAAANEAYADAAPTRTPGTDTETSFDVVTINRVSRIIYCTRVGAGDDREVHY